MAIIKKFASYLNLTNFQVFQIDKNPSSDYFRITELESTLTGGKNGFLIEGSEYLKETTEIKIEILDVEGNPVYFEPGDGIPEYYEGTSKLISVHVYDDTPIGIGKITILGELKNYIATDGSVLPIPDEWKGVYNVKWETEFQINKNLENETRVRFYKRPLVTITELVKPIFSKTIPTKTDTGHVHGISEIPPAGTDITNWRAGTTYKLQRTSGSWDRDVDENTISVSSPTFSGKITEVLNDTEVLVDTAYNTSNIVSNFTSGSFTVSYSDFNNQTIGETTLTGSFAKIDITRLKTFVGDVARVKVFRKSRNAVGDFQFVQESKLESSELLRDITTQNDTELSYGRFDESNLSTYWVSSSNDHPLSIDSSVLSQAVKFDYNNVAGGVQQLITSESISLSTDVEYTLNFKTLLSGSLTTNKSIRAFFSSSNFTQDFLTISGSAIYTTRQDISKNIISQNTGDAKLVFEVQGDDWYISNASLKNAQETSFSPDEFVLIQDIPRKTASETFDFRFEFYDINNNYIPVDVTAVGVFDGGNDFPSSGKLLTFESDRNAFRFSSGSVQNPTGQQIQLKVTQNNLTGSVTFASSAFDVDGNYLNPSDYSQYPGKLTSVNSAGAIITINNFTGSRTDGLDTPFVGSVVYTASLENLEEFETVYRLEDGDNAPQLIVTSNANQFIYEPTTLSPKPSGQSITVRAQRKNLASLITPIEVNSGSNRPELTFVNTVGGIDTYTISATAFSQSFAANNFDEVTYSFTGSDVFGNSQTDEITLSKVINFDAVSIILTNESTSFPAKSTGEVTGGFAASSGSVQMYIGGTQITHDDYDSDSSRNRNTFDIKTITATNVTATDTSPNTANYSISAFNTTKDSGSLLLDIEYLAGDNSTSQSFEKVVSYTKSKKAVPTVLTKTSPSSQTINSSSAGFETVQNVEVIVQEGGTEFTYDSSLSGGGDSNVRKFDIVSVHSGSDNGDGTITPTAGTFAAYNGTIGSASLNYVDSEGTYVTGKLVRFDVSVSKTGIDGQDGQDGADGVSGANGVVINISPTSQTIKRSNSGTYDTPKIFTVTVQESGSLLTHQAGTGTPATSKYTITSLSNGTLSAGSGTTSPDITPTTPSTTAGLTTTFNITYTDGKGNTSSALAQSHVVSVVLDGTTGPGIVHTGEWEAGRAYQYADGLSDGDGRIDTVLYSGVYYAATSAHTSTNNTNASTGVPGSGPWESLGSQDLFVAAKIAIFEDSFVQNTLNIGTNNSGGVSSANITLAGATANPYISIGQSGTLGSQGYEAGDGIFIGRDTDNEYKASFENGSTSYLKWTGTSLDIKGTINVTGGNAATQAYANTVGTNAVASGSASAAAAQTAAELFAQTASANAVVSGSNAASTAQSNAITQAQTDASASVNLLANGNWTAGSGTFITSNSISSPVIAGNAGYISTIFRVGQDGITLDGTNKKIFVGTGAYENANTPFYFASGSSDIFSLGEKLSWDGSTLSISGTINVTGGNAATQTDAANAVTSGSNAADNAATSASNAQSTANNAQAGVNAINDTTTSLENPTSYDFGPAGSNGQFALDSVPASPNTAGLYLGAEYMGYHDGSSFKTFISSSGDAFFEGTVSGSSILGGNITIGGGNFEVNNDGRLTATDAIISGEISSSEATLGAWLVNEDAITATAGTVVLNATDEYIHLKDADLVTKVNLNTNSSLTTPSAGNSNNGTENAALRNGSTTSNNVFWSPSVTRENITSFAASSSGNHQFTYQYTNGNNSYVSATGTGTFITGKVTLKVWTGGYGSSAVTSTTIESKTAQGNTFDDAPSVIGNTEIILSNGLIKLAKDITKEDELLTWDYKTKNFATAKPSLIKTRTVYKTYKVYVEDKEVEVSENHGFWLENNHEIKVKKLKAGKDKIYIKDGNEVKLCLVKKVEKIHKEEKVFTFRIPKYENYISNEILSHNPGYDETDTQYFTDNKSATVSWNASSGVTYYFTLEYTVNGSLVTAMGASNPELLYNFNYDGTWAWASLNSGTEINNSGLQVSNDGDRVFRADTSTTSGNPWITMIGGMNVDYFVPKYSHPTAGTYSYGSTGNTDISYNKKAYPLTRAMWRLQLNVSSEYSGTSTTITLDDPHINIVGAMRFASNGSVGGNNERDQYFRVQLDETMTANEACPVVSSYGRAGDTPSFSNWDAEFTSDIGVKYGTSGYVYYQFMDNDTSKARDAYTHYGVVFG